MEEREEAINQLIETSDMKNALIDLLYTVRGDYAATLKLTKIIKQLHERENSLLGKF